MIKKIDSDGWTVYECEFGHDCYLGELIQHEGQIKCIFHIGEESRVGYPQDFTEEELSEIKQL